MVDTFHPLHVTQAAMDLDDPKLPISWLPPEDAAGEAASSASVARRRSRTDPAAPALRGGRRERRRYDPVGLS